MFNRFATLYRHCGLDWNSKRGALKAQTTDLPREQGSFFRAEEMLKDLRRVITTPTLRHQYPSPWILWLAGVQHLAYQVNDEHRLTIGTTYPPSRS